MSLLTTAKRIDRSSFFAYRTVFNNHFIECAGFYSILCYRNWLYECDLLNSAHSSFDRKAFIFVFRLFLDLNIRGATDRYVARSWSRKIYTIDINLKPKTANLTRNKMVVGGGVGSCEAAGRKWTGTQSVHGCPLVNVDNGCVFLQLGTESGRMSNMITNSGFRLNHLIAWQIVV